MADITMIYYFTNYPIEELGDKPDETPPFRACELLSYDGDKYCKIKVDGVTTEIKLGYVYTHASNIMHMYQKINTLKHLLTTGYDLVAESVEATRQYDYMARAKYFVLNAIKELK